MLKSRMEMLGERQKTLAQNVANVSTPGYTANDVDVDKFNKALANGEVGGTNRRGVRMMTTNPGHIAAGTRAPLANGVSIQKSPDSETTLDGNSVVVEEQMMKMAETRMEFETAVQLYSKGLSLVRLAAKSPTR
tara:strand:+ start:144 stop:545 length:402 start_codon:yes stop_codon:yes gene_type:complete